MLKSAIRQERRRTQNKALLAFRLRIKHLVLAHLQKAQDILAQETQTAAR
jgi:hypothetical protein